MLFLFPDPAFVYSIFETGESWKPRILISLFNSTVSHKSSFKICSFQLKFEGCRILEFFMSQFFRSRCGVDSCVLHLYHQHNIAPTNDSNSLRWFCCLSFDHCIGTGTFLAIWFWFGTAKIYLHLHIFFMMHVQNKLVIPYQVPHTYAFSFSYYNYSCIVRWSWSGIRQCCRVRWWVAVNGYCGKTI